MLKFLLKKYLQKENGLLNKHLLTILKENKINFLDIGASHGIPERWFFLEEGLKKILVEPHSETSKDLKYKDNIVIEKLLGKNVGENLSFYETKKRRCSSFGRLRLYKNAMLEHAGGIASLGGQVDLQVR